MESNKGLHSLHIHCIDEQFCEYIRIRSISFKRTSGIQFHNKKNVELWNSTVSR